MTNPYSVRATGFNAEGTYSPDELVISVEQAGVRTIASGANAAGSPLQRGTVLGKITASGKLTISLAAASDGSQTPYCVLAEDVDASAADADAAVFLAAQLNSNKLIYGTGHSLSTVFDPFRTVDIHLQTAMPW